MSPPPPRRKLRSASRKPNRDPSPTRSKRSRRCSTRNENRGKDASSPPVELNFENDNTSSSVTNALTTQTNRGITTTSVNNRAIVVFDSTLQKNQKIKIRLRIVLKLEKHDVEGGWEG